MISDLFDKNNLNPPKKQITKNINDYPLFDEEETGFSDLTEVDKPEDVLMDRAIPFNVAKQEIQYDVFMKSMDMLSEGPHVKSDGRRSGPDKTEKNKSEIIRPDKTAKKGTAKTDKKLILKNSKTANELLKETAESLINGEVKEFKSADPKTTNKEITTDEPIDELEAVTPENAEDVTELETLAEEELGTVEELEEVQDEGVDELISKIDSAGDNIEYPGNIDINKIDRQLDGKEPARKKINGKDADKGDMFGVNRVEVFYTIDKQIYSARSSTKFGKEKMRGVKRGLFLPSMVMAMSFSLLIAISIIMTIYFKNTSTATLEDNVISDNSILAKIAKQKEEEAKNASLKLESEMKKLEVERKNIESTINEELLKKQAEIENKFKKKMEELNLKAIPREEMEKLRAQYDKERESALDKAKDEKKQKIEEQERLIAEKDKKLTDAMDSLRKKGENYEAELARIKQEFEARRVEEQKQREATTQKLTEIRINDERIKSFNSTIYQLIANSMEDFQKGKKDDAIKKLGAVLKYYNSSIDFVAANPELKNKMQTDMFFVETIRGLIEESKAGVDYAEYARIINKFKKVTDYYQKAENLYTQKDFNNSGKEYAKVLQQFDEINLSYSKMRDVEKQVQNEKAIIFYNQGLGYLKNQQYDIAIDKFTTVIKEAPLSDYANLSLQQIMKASDNMTAKDKPQVDNVKAKGIFQKAEELEKSGRTDEALKSYQLLITDFAGSDYTKRALDKSLALNKQLNDQEKDKELNKYKGDLKNKFETNFKKYEDYYAKGDIPNARRSYFEALKGAFDIYTNNSINDFITAEDEYIQSLVADNRNKSQDELLKKQEELVKKYEKSLEVQEKLINDLEKEKLGLKTKLDLLEKDKAALKTKMDTVDSTVNLSTKQKKDLVEKYESEINKKNEEIERYRKYIEEKEKQLSVDENENIKKDYEERLKAEKEKAETLRKQLFEYYKKDSELSAEKEKAGALEKKLSELQTRYNTIEKKYNDKTVSPEEKKKIEEEYSGIYEEKFRLEKEKAVETEKQKIKQDFEAEMVKMREYISNLNAQLAEKQIADTTVQKKKIAQYRNLYFGRVTDVVNDSIAFMFLTPEAMSMYNVKAKDRIKVIRFVKTADSKEEVVTGLVDITSVNPGSQYGRGKISETSENYSVQVGDLLRN